MEVTILNKEEGWNFIKTYRDAFGRDPSDDEVNDHLERVASPDGVSWLNPFEIFQVGDIPLKLVTLLDMDDVNKYSCVDLEISGTLSIRSDLAVISVTNFVINHPTDWSVFIINLAKVYVSLLRSAIFLFMSVCSPRQIYDFLCLSSR